MVIDYIATETNKFYPTHPGTNNYSNYGPKYLPVCYVKKIKGGYRIRYHDDMIKDYVDNQITNRLIFVSDFAVKEISYIRKIW